MARQINAWRLLPEVVRTCDNAPMAEAKGKADTKPRRGGPVTIASLVGRILDPLTARRGFATPDLIAAWPEIAGPRFADCSRPEKIVWPKGPGAEGKPALLILRVDGPKAILVQHEAGQIVDRVNAFLGYAAIGQVRIVQAPVGPNAPKPAMPEAALSAEDEARLSDTLTGVADEKLKAALGRLGRGVLSDRRGGGHDPGEIEQPP
jgi:hypothetical protein